MGAPLPGNETALSTIMGLHPLLSAMRGLVTWAGALDVLVVAWLIYRLLLLVRGSRAMQILGGLLTLVLALFVSEKLQLNTLNWLLHQVLPLGPVALVILFYPELRHALEEFGPRFWGMGLHRNSPDDNAIEAVVSALTGLSDSKTGGLVVFARTTGLDEIIASGTPLDCAVSPAIVETIFHKGTPLHDGAVVIKAGRIAAAGCILPLTDRPRLDAAFHTRHKAALGMSENSDAVVAIVSEETGTISLAVGGKLIRGLRGDSLRRRLDALLSPQDRLPSVVSLRKVARRHAQPRPEEDDAPADRPHAGAGHR
ncbi:MAG: diadenylate cyclase CdaA [Armatimonadetes bacterium]|nr:diadenylate cyclase CdaA [Armatimonadota bacterium]MDE2206016.1 diadenylate cyclase CdaA [Armatimonadota bacterium]